MTAANVVACRVRAFMRPHASRVVFVSACVLCNVICAASVCADTEIVATHTRPALFLFLIVPGGACTLSVLKRVKASRREYRTVRTESEVRVA